MNDSILRSFEETFKFEQVLQNLKNLIRDRKDQKLNDAIPVILVTLTGQRLKADLLSIENDEVMTTIGPGSFVVYKMSALRAIYPPLQAL